MSINNHIAFINYSEIGKQVALTHTEVSQELAGTGAAAAIVEKTLIYIEANNLSLLPFCPYVFAFIKKHPEWKRIVNKGFKAYDEL